MHLSNSSVVALLFAAALSLSASTISRAQTLSNVPAGARIRVVLADSLRQGPIFPARQLVAGRLVRTTVDSVTLRLMGSGDFSVARSSIKSAQVSRGVSPVRSAIVFGIFAGSMSALLTNFNGPNGRYHQSQDMLVAGGIGFGAGALIGAISPFEQWHRLRK